MDHGELDAVRFFNESSAIDPSQIDVEQPGGQDERFKLQVKKDDLMRKSIGMFDRVLKNAIIPPEERLQVLEKYVELIPDCGYDMLTRFRDAVQFVKNSPEGKGLIRLLALVVKSHAFDDHQRYTTVLCLYNNFEYWICYECFTHIAFDVDTDYKYRADAARYLVATEAKEHVTSAQEAIIDILETKSIPSEKRYEIIVSFISKTGISTIMASTKLRVKYNEKFVCGLQTTFFYDRENGIRERILSGQNLLQMASAAEGVTPLVAEEEKQKIIDELFTIIDNGNYDENVRADAADVILRNGGEEQQTRAKLAIRNMGFSKVIDNPTGCMAFIGKTDTIYQNSQNIHDFSDQILAVMEKLVLDVTPSKSYADIHEEIMQLIKKHTQGNSRRKFSAMKALSRINIDTAVFTKYNITLPELIQRVFTVIQSQEEEVREELEKRLVDELADMGDTCSSGHSDRFVNVLQGYFFNLTVSWKEQIQSNLEGRIQAAIKLCDDNATKEILSIIQTPIATDEDKEVYREFLAREILRIKDEMTLEFVGGGHLTIEAFDEHFSEAEKKWHF